MEENRGYPGKPDSGPDTRPNPGAPVPDTVPGATSGPDDAGPPPTDLRAARRDFSRLGLGAFAALIIGSALQILLSSVLSALGIEIFDSWLLWVVTFVPLYCVAVPIGLSIMRQVPAHPPESRPLGVGRFLSIMCISVFLMLVGSGLGIQLLGLLNRLLGTSTENPVLTYVSNDSLPILNILFLVLIGPLVEEYMFRKVFIDAARIYGERLALVTSALVFGLYHGNLSQFFYAFFLGLVFGYVYLETGWLRYSAALHILINFQGSFLAPIAAGIDQEALTEMDAEALLMDPAMLAAVLYSAFLSLLVVLGLILFLTSLRRIRFAPAEREIPRGRRFLTVWCNLGMGLLTAGCLSIFVFSLIRL